MKTLNGGKIKMATLDASCWNEVFEWCKKNEVEIDVIQPDDYPLRVFPFVRYTATKKRLVKMIEKFWQGNTSVMSRIELEK